MSSALTNRRPQTVCGWQPEIWEHIAKFLPPHCLYIIEASFPHSLECNATQLASME